MFMKTIVLTGGGSAGHVTPNMALIPTLQKHFDRIFYIGTNGIEKQIVKEFNIPFMEIEAVKLIRSLNLKNLLIPFKLFSSINQSKRILKKIKPSVVFSKGGFVSLPVVIAAKKLGIPVVSHESDYTMGLANKIITKYAKVVCTSFSKTASLNKKCVFTGSPIRQTIKKGKAEVGKKITNIRSDKKTIMFFGGSLGSKKINDVVFESLDELLKSYNIIHITGKNNDKKISKKDYYSTPFSNQIEHLFALSDIVVCRAGSNSIFELLSINKPMVLVPLSKKTSRGDQIENAESFEQLGYAKVLHEENLCKETLIETIKNLDIEKMSSKMRTSKLQNGNENIVNQILKHSK